MITCYKLIKRPSSREPSVKIKMWLPTFILLLATAQWIEGEFLGCYEDNEVRLLPGFVVVLTGIATPAKCMYLCQQLQYQYAGMEFGNQCFCGRDKPYQRMKVDGSRCNALCPFTQEKCGGNHWEIGVYSVDSYIFPTKDLRQGSYLGCYLENSNNRTLRNFQAYLWHQNSPRECTQVCTALGYIYAGVTGDMCTCGNTKPDNERQKEDSGCQVSCINSEEKCGGDNRISIYRTSVNTNAESVVTDERCRENAVGCFEDSESRILSEYYASFTDINSPKNCLYLCQQFGFRYAGVHNGTDCYCGNQLPTKSKHREDYECQVFCPYSTERCGGPMRTYIYSTKKFPNSLHADLETSGDSPFRPTTI
nr:WSC domain-containing protein ARB_07867 isoform X2 [Halyomorpha halys]